ncbi:MAG: NDP-sugar synthase [Patescibacteria group bacterium]
MRAFILAGGFATRLWPLTEKRAKPLLPLRGKPILTHLVEKIPADLPVTVSTNAAFEDAFEEWRRDLGRSETEIVVEGTKHDDEKLGAVGATAEWITRRNIDEDVLLLTGDNYLGFSMEQFLASYHEGTTLLATYDIKDLPKASSFGTVILSPGASRRILAFEEKPLQPKTTLVSTGCSVLPRSTLPVLLDYAKGHRDNVGGVFEEFLRQGIPIECFTFHEPWLDIGSFPAYLEAHRLLVQHETIVHPSSDVSGSTFEGSNTIDRDCIVTGSSLTDCMIFRGCTVRDCVLRDCIVDEGCVLKNVDLDSKMLRAGTVLEGNERHE